MERNGESREKKTAGPSDYLANERTFLAWIRTAIAIMAFGFVFSLFVKQLSLVFPNNEVVMPVTGHSGLIGISLVALGAVMALLAFLRYKKIESHLKNGTYYPSSPLIILLTLSILIGTIFLVLYLLPNI